MSATVAKTSEKDIVFIVFIVVDLVCVPVNLLTLLKTMRPAGTTLYLVLNSSVAGYVELNPWILDEMGTIIVEAVDGRSQRLQCLVNVCDKYDFKTGVLYIDSTNQINGSADAVIERLKLANVTEGQWLSIPGFTYFRDAAAVRQFVGFIGASDRPVETVANAKHVGGNGVWRAIKGIFRFVARATRSPKATRATRATNRGNWFW